MHVFALLSLCLLYMVESHSFEECKVWEDSENPTVMIPPALADKISKENDRRSDYFLHDISWVVIALWS